MGRPSQISHEDVASLAEAASVTLVHSRLKDWLGTPRFGGGVYSSEDFGNESGPEPEPSARQAGYRLAADLRERLDLGVGPVESMRDLLADRLGVNVVWADLSSAVAGATFTCADHDGNQVRGVVSTLEVGMRMSGPVG